MTADFDRYQESYTAEVDRAIAFAHTDADFFAELKATNLVAISKRHFGTTAQVNALDFGCGTGVIDGLLEPSFAAVFGVDVSSGLLEVAARANPGLEYRQYDGHRIPYDDDRFDVGFAACVFHHIEPDERAGAAAELARVVKPGGLVVVYEHSPVNPLTRVAVSRCEFDEGVQLLPRRETRSLLRHSGLQLIDSRYIAFFPWRGRALRALERGLARLPLGGQYVMSATKTKEPS
jgi:SAM-dependent methyltransferase